MAGRVIKRLLAGVLTVAVVIPGNFVPAQAAEEPQEDYLIYPNPHKVEYQEGDYILGKELNVIYDKESMRRQRTVCKRRQTSKESR